jgi:hypothetical protein
VEFWAALDPDDDPPPADMDWVNFHIASRRYGYAHLNQYYNELAEKSSGKWLFMWNDDAAMITYGWDDAVMKAPEDQVLYAPHYPLTHEGNCFPIVPMAWVRAWGYFSPYPCNDWWVCDVAKEVGKYGYEVPIKIWHQRVYDKSFSEQDRSFVDQYHSKHLTARRHADAEKIRQLLRESQ